VLDLLFKYFLYIFLLKAVSRENALKLEKNEDQAIWPTAKE